MVNLGIFCYHIHMPEKFTETLSFKITRKRKLELIKIAKDLNIPISRACRAAADNFIAYRKRWGGDITYRKRDRLYSPGGVL